MTKQIERPLNTPLQALRMFFVYFAPDRDLVAAFAYPHDAVDYVLAHEAEFGFVPNRDLIITDASGYPKLSVL